MNRSIQPGIKRSQKISYYKPKEKIMPNGIKLYSILAGSQDVMRVSFVFNSGTRYQSKLFTASAAFNMLNEGSENFSGKEIAEELDFYGASYELSIDRDWALISVYFLTKYCDKILSIISDFVKKPTYPEEEFQLYKLKQKQRLLMESDKIEFIAREQFLNKLFGATHPYGITAKPDDYNHIYIDDLVDYHNKFISSNRAFIMIAGKFSDKEETLIETYFGKDSWGEVVESPLLPQPITNTDKKTVINKNNAKQTAIRIGKIMVNKNHPDYIPLVLLTTLLGGYFGSRLMQNIREDKGYTYGIYATMVSLQYSTYLVISTEVGNEYKELVISEIEKELLRLQTELISVEELEMVKQYIYGEMMRALDGAWGQAEVAIDIIQTGLDSSYLDYFFHKMEKIKPDDLLKTANLYFNPETFIQIFVGPTN